MDFLILLTMRLCVTELEGKHSHIFYVNSYALTFLRVFFWRHYYIFKRLRDSGLI